MSGPPRHPALLGLALTLALLTAAGCAAGSSSPAPPTSATEIPDQSTPAEADATEAPSAGEDTQSQQVDACTLVTADEMASVVGKLKSGPVPLKGPAGEVLMCNYVAENGGKISLNVENALQWGVVKGVADANKDADDVPGVGEAAFLEPSGDGYILSILKKPHLLGIAIAVSSDKSHALDIGKAVAQKALPRL